MHIPANRLLPALGGCVSLWRKVNLVPYSCMSLNLVSKMFDGIALSRGIISNAESTCRDDLVMIIDSNAATKSGLGINEPTEGQDYDEAPYLNASSKH